MNVVWMAIYFKPTRTSVLRKFVEIKLFICLIIFIPKSWFLMNSLIFYSMMVSSCPARSKTFWLLIECDIIISGKIKVLQPLHTSVWFLFHFHANDLSLGHEAGRTNYNGSRHETKLRWFKVFNVWKMLFIGKLIWMDYFAFISKLMEVLFKARYKDKLVLVLWMTYNPGHHVDLQTTHDIGNKVLT